MGGVGAGDGGCGDGGEGGGCEGGRVCGVWVGVGSRGVVWSGGEVGDLEVESGGCVWEGKRASVVVSHAIALRTPLPSVSAGTIIAPQEEGSDTSKVRQHHPQG